MGFDVKSLIGPIVTQAGDLIDLVNNNGLITLIFVVFFALLVAAIIAGTTTDAPGHS